MYAIRRTLHMARWIVSRPLARAWGRGILTFSILLVFALIVIVFDTMTSPMIGAVETSGSVDLTNHWLVWETITLCGLWLMATREPRVKDSIQGIGPISNFTGFSYFDYVVFMVSSPKRIGIMLTPTLTMLPVYFLYNGDSAAGDSQTILLTIILVLLMMCISLLFVPTVMLHNGTVGSIVRVFRLVYLYFFSRSIFVAYWLLVTLIDAAYHSLGELYRIKMRWVLSAYEVGNAVSGCVIFFALAFYMRQSRKEGARLLSHIQSPRRIFCADCDVCSFLHKRTRSGRTLRE